MSDRIRTHHDLGWPAPDETHPNDPRMTDPPHPHDGVVITHEEFREYLQLWYSTELVNLEWLTDEQAVILMEMLDESLFGSYSDGSGKQLEGYDDEDQQ